MDLSGYKGCMREIAWDGNLEEKTVRRIRNGRRPAERAVGFAAACAVFLALLTALFVYPAVSTRFVLAAHAQGVSEQTLAKGVDFIPGAASHLDFGDGTSPGSNRSYVNQQIYFTCSGTGIRSVTYSSDTVQFLRHLKLDPAQATEDYMAANHIVIATRPGNLKDSDPFDAYQLLGNSYTSDGSGADGGDYLIRVPVVVTSSFPNDYRWEIDGAVGIRVTVTFDNGLKSQKTVAIHEVQGKSTTEALSFSLQ